MRLRLTARHDDWGDLRIEVESPNGMLSRMADVHSPAFDAGIDWAFMSVRHWGEQGEGLWKVRISDRRFLNRGSIVGMTLELHGQSLPDQAPKLSLRRRSGRVELECDGPGGRVYHLQRSADLRNWEGLGIVQWDRDPALFTDPKPLDAVSFYRLMRVTR